MERRPRSPATEFNPKQEKIRRPKTKTQTGRCLSGRSQGPEAYRDPSTKEVVWSGKAWVFRLLSSLECLSRCFLYTKKAVRQGPRVQTPPKKVFWAVFWGVKLLIRRYLDPWGLLGLEKCSTFGRSNRAVRG